jgi:hypothetical protein
MERLIQFLDAAGGLLDGALQANRGLRRSIGFATAWLDLTGVTYFIPGTIRRTATATSAGIWADPPYRPR